MYMPVWRETPRVQLESSSAGTGFEAPRLSCLSNWETEQTSAVDGCLLVGVSSNLGGGGVEYLEELVIGANTVCLIKKPFVKR